MRRSGEINRPVDLARQLITYGASLGQAHDILDRVAGGETVSVALHAEDRQDAIRAFAELGVEARVVRRSTVDVPGT